MSDTTSELRQAILYKLLKYGNDQAEDLKPDADVVSNEIMQLIAAQRQQWEVAARKDELQLLDTEMQKYIDYPIKEKTPFTHALKQSRLSYIQMQRLVKEHIAALDAELGKEQ